MSAWTIKDHLLSDSFCCLMTGMLQSTHLDVWTFNDFTIWSVHWTWSWSMTWIVTGLCESPKFMQTNTINSSNAQNPAIFMLFPSQNSIQFECNKRFPNFHSCFLRFILICAFFRWKALLCTARSHRLWLITGGASKRYKTHTNSWIEHDRHLVTRRQWFIPNKRNKDTVIFSIFCNEIRTWQDIIRC